MKTINTILIMAISFLLILSHQISGQVITHTHIDLIDTKGNKVSFEEVIDNNKKTMVVFWNSNNKKHIDLLDMYSDSEEYMLMNDDVEIVAICTDKHHNYQQLQSIMASKMWNINLYIDTNKSFKRINNISDENLKIIMFENGKMMAAPPINNQDLST